jgi:DNA-binding IclR family transcriptional regulator
VFIARERGESAVSLDSYTGQSGHLHTTALGKTVLAYLPRDRVEAIIDRQGLLAMTDQTITDREALFDGLDSIRQREYASDREERIKGLNCVAIPVLNDDILPELRRAANISEPNRRGMPAEDRVDALYRLSVWIA